MFKFRKIPFYLGKAGFLNWMPDTPYLKLMFRSALGYKLNLSNLVTFNEKLQWLKLHDRNPEYTVMVDKYAVRDYVGRKIGEEYLIPLLGVWNDPDEIDFDTLPNQFVLKTNHDSGGLTICSDKSKFDKELALKKLRKSIKRKYYKFGREYPYRDVPKKVICEKFMSDNSHDNNADLTDYKFYCFDGKADCVMTCSDRKSGHTKFYYFDRNWNLLRNYNIAGSKAPTDFTMPKPACIDKMFEIAEILAKDIPHVRVDLYSCDDKIYFGELTFYSDSGFDVDLTEFLNRHWGNLITVC